ncbi:MAG: MBL fold metallo-hydrolase [Christensenella sp.]|nr:MBL fold metallo-hydrolase [Christensenella sp.]
MTKNATRSFSRVLLLFLCLALLAGCTAAPSGDSEDVLTDADAPSSASDSGSTQTIPPDRMLTLSTEPLEQLSTENAFEVLYVNVGKADAAILRFGETAVLIDTGSAESAPQLIGGLNALGVTSISAVFVTHSHSDHLGGLAALSANYDIPMVYSPFYSEPDKNGTSKIVKRAEKLNLPHTELKAGDVVPITDDVSFTVLGPLSLNEEDDNENSLVLQFTYGGKTFLFTGDMQFIAEQTLIASGVSLKSDVLKVGNHGNPDATGDDFGALVAPDFAVISTDTMVDTDSANPRVYTALPNAQIIVTQDFPIGVLLTLDDSGAISLHNPARQPSNVSVSVDSFDVQAQTITLVNSGADSVDLSGMILLSVRSDAALRFPDGTALAAGDQLIIGAGGNFTFSAEDKPLNKKKDNTVILYDRLGSLVSKLEQ